MDHEPDALEELIAERTARNPDFPKLVEAAKRRRVLLKELGRMREKEGRSQTAVAAEMETSQSAIARLEKASGDARISTVDRFAQVLGFRIQWHLLPLDGSESEPPLVIHGG